MNPRTTLILFVLAAGLGAFLWFYELGGEAERAEAEAAAHRVFPDVTAESIDHIELVTEDGTRAVLERSDGAWRLREPIDFPADAFAADGVAQALAELSSEAVFEEPEPLSEYGLDGEPAVRFRAGGTEYTLRVGDKTPVGGNTYVAAGDASRVLAVPTYRATSLSKPLQTLRDPRVVVFDREAVTGLRAEWPGGAVELAKDGDGWRLTAPLEGPADVDTVEGLLSTLQFLRAEAFEDEPPPDPQAGLDAPSFEVSLRSGSEDVAHLVVGSALSGTQRFARGRAEGTLYRIADARLDDLPRTVTAYRFKELARFDVGAAARFELDLRGGDETLTVTGTRGESGWTTEPRAMAPGAADRLVSELSALEATEIAAESMGADELSALALAPPRVRVRVFGEDAPESPALADVSFGVADPERGIAARSEGDPRVYWLDYALAEELPVSLEAFRNRFVSAEEAPGDEAGAGAEAASGAEASGGAETTSGDAAPPAADETGGSAGGADDAAGAEAAATPSSDAAE